MIETLQLEEAARVHYAPTLLVEWSSPWSEFLTSIRPALARSQARLAGEAPYGIFPYRGMFPAWAIEAFLIFAVIVVRVKLAEMRPYVVPRLSSHDVIYYSGDELPRTQDLGGAEAGTNGRAGGEEAHHRTQTIKIARGSSLVPRVVDAPNLKLPSSRDAVANLLAVTPNPGPPPSEGFRSTRVTFTPPTPVIAPAPNVIRDFTRNGVSLDAVISPAPSVSRDPFRSAPNVSATVIPPAPNVSNDHALVAPALGPAVIPPAPSVSRDHTLTAPSLSTSVIAPAPSVARDQMRSAPALATSVIAPAPSAVSREVSSAPLQMTNMAVVQPPVSAPERATTRSPKLPLPSPAVIAPPPSSDVSQDMRRLPSGSVPDPSKAVVPPPPTQPTGFVSSLIGKIFGASEVVPPPPAVNSTVTRGNTGTALGANVVPPPPTVGTNAAGGHPKGTQNGTGASIGSNVIAPPPSAGVNGGTGTRSLATSAAPTLGSAGVVPPPPSLSGPGGGTGTTGGGAGTASGTLLANNVVPPPPALGAGSASVGSGLGRKGTGQGGPMDIGSAVAPPASGGSGSNAGTVVSDRPGPKVGLPTTGGTGSLALSPSGGAKPGLGGAEGGTGIGRGNGPGSGLNGAGPGAGKTAAGHGSDPAAHGGISPNPGPGGAGNVPNGTPPVRGVDISGGTTQVTIPSFGSDPGGIDPSVRARSSIKQRQSFDVDIVATASSGGAFEPYKNLLRGEKHTSYLETSSAMGTAVMEYADESAASRGSLTAPRPIRTNLPEGLPRIRMMVMCALDTGGNLKILRVLEPGPADVTAKVMAALRSWKFQPALHGDQPVEVTAIIGFNIDTNDRY